MQENSFKYHHNICNLGVSIFNLNEKIDIQKLCDVLYTIKKTKTSVNKSNIGGYQTESNLHLNNLFFPLINNINNLGKNFTTSPNISLKNMWGNISSFTHYNQIHNHLSTSPSFNLQLSGIVYLKVPKNSGKIIFYNPLNLNTAHCFTPKENEIFLFPSTLYHSVEPNLSQEDRISIAFNFN